MLQAAQDGQHRQAAIPMALLTAVDGEPAKPPARGVTWVGVNHVEADQCAGCLDGKHRVSQSPPGCRENIRNWTEKTLDLIRIEFKSFDHAELGVAEPTVTKGRNTPYRRHGTLRADEERMPNAGC